jgi:hypothetical protein
MKGDFSRWNFKRSKHGAGLLHQQGRVWLDADWNEDTATRLELLREETVDIVGGCGVPEPGTAFRIAPNPDPNSAPDDFVITGGAGAGGRAYVGGLLCTLEQSVTYLTQPDLPDPPRLKLAGPASPAPPPANAPLQTAIVYLEAWQRLITYLEDDELREIALGGPDTAARLRTVAQVKLLPVSQNGIDCAQASKLLPRPGRGTLSTLPPVDALPPDPCRIPDPGTYTGRENHLYRVEIHDGGDVRGASGGGSFSLRPAQSIAAGATELTLAQALQPAQLAALLQSRVVALEDDQGRLEIVPVHGATASSLTLARGVRRGFLADRPQLVRGGAARFKWSRDNAAFAVRALEIRNNRQTLALDSLGRDQITALRAGDLVEICDDASELGPARGHLTRLSVDPDPDLLTVTLADPLPPELRADRHLLVRRWDGWGWCAARFDALDTPDMNLGDGVHIQFGGADLRAGDYWLFAARSADGSVERLTDAPPHGIERFRCLLAVVEWGGVTVFERPQVLLALRAGDLSAAQIAQVDQILGAAAAVEGPAIQAALQQIGLSTQRIGLVMGRLGPGTQQTRFRVADDCRNIFPPLTALTHLHYVSGDGQTTVPGGALPRPLQAGVVNGTRPVAGAPVRFRITAGGGFLSGAGGAGASVVVPTGPDGVAECAWQLDQGTQSQQVEATLLDLATTPVRYNAAFATQRGGEPPPRPATCELTVGPGGDFDSLEQAIDVLRGREERAWCLCLLPGRHSVERDLELSGAQSVTISACGPSTILSLKDRSLIAGDLSAVTLRGFGIEASGSQGLVFRGCQRVVLEQLALGIGDNPDRSAISCEGCQQLFMREVGGEFARLRAMVELRGVSFIHIERCLLAGLGDLAVGIFCNGDHELLQLSRNRISVRADEGELDHAVLVIDEANRDGQQTVLEDNILGGAVSLYGQSGRSPLKEGELPGIARRLPQMRLQPVDSAFRARGNRLARITIGEKVLSQLRDGARFPVYGIFQLSDNVFSDGDTVLLAARHALAGNHFTLDKPSPNLGRMLAAVIGLGATFSGNHGENPDLMLGVVVTQAPPGGNPTAVERLMNMILIQRI